MKIVIAILFLLVGFLPLSWGEESRLTVSTNSDSYERSSIVLISGKVGPDMVGASDQVLIEVFDPQGRLYASKEVSIGTEGSYEYPLPVGKESDIEGVYRITVTHLEQKAETIFAFRLSEFTCSDLDDFIGVPPRYTTMIDGRDFSVRYIGPLQNITANPERSSLEIIVPDNSGCLFIELPRTLIDAKKNEVDAEFIVLVNGKQTDFTESKNSPAYRELEIEFPIEGSKKVEILGTQVAPEFSLMTLVASVGLSAGIVCLVASRYKAPQ